jgi:PncC family amidohydrolase
MAPDTISTLAVLVGTRLNARCLMLATAESCTGGWVSMAVTSVPGSSEWFERGFVTYSNEAKEQLLGVAASTIALHGAVSEAVAREMAAGARKKFGADFAMAVTGIAGPCGGTKSKPVGTVFIALADGCETVVERKMNPSGREQFKRDTADQALKMLHLRLMRT